ncbi:MAG: tRNA 2-selenouridine(34) synthase MnmH [Burkholderiaceae bacterium]|nr:tRNA 2-selenouridine(34) synthase MnmH [Burkholderiaceae bacterium]
MTCALPAAERAGIPDVAGAPDASRPGARAKTIGAAEALAGLARFHTIIDVRSESEFAFDHLPGAVNCPVLSDEERVRIGTLYKQASPFHARRAGAALVAANVARHLSSCLRERPRDWSALVYCWRGGERSAALVHVLDRIGWNVHQLEGGYRAFRRFVVQELTRLPPLLRMRVLCGATGSGKSRLLWHLERCGAQMLALESLAAHRGSVLGNLPGCPQPSQKRFETRLWWALRQIDPARTVFVESESRRIGSCQVPDALLDAMRSSDCVKLELSAQQRIRLLRDEYRHYESCPQLLAEQLETLAALHGKDVVERWQSLARSGQWDELVARLLEEHYDPVYSRSIRTNYRRAAEAGRVSLPSADEAQFEQAARELVAQER